MRHRSFITVTIGILATLIAILITAGCGEDNKFVGTAAPATQIQCESNAPSLIPAPKGKPIYVEFFRDT